MDESLAIDGHFHTPHEDSPERSPASLLAMRKSTPFRPRSSRKRNMQVERRALFGTVSAKAFLMVVLFVKLILISIAAHYVMTDAAWHFQHGRELHNPVYIAIPVSTLFIVMAMFGIGTNIMLLLLPFLVLQVISNVMMAFAVGSLSWYHFREFFTRKEFGIAIASFILPLWMYSYVTCVSFRVFLSIFDKTPHTSERNWKRSWANVETAIDVDDLMYTDRQDTGSAKKKVRFLDSTLKQH